MGDEHPVERKLRQSIVPYFVSGARLKFAWPHSAYNFYAYTRDVAAGIGGLGVFPLLSVFSDSEQVNNIANEISELPLALRAPAIVLFVSWVALRVALARTNGEKRAHLAKDFRLELRRLETEMYRALGTSDPMPVLLVIQEKLEVLVDRAISDDVYPWVQRYAPGIESEVERRIVDIRNRFAANWIPAPEGGRVPQP